MPDLNTLRQLVTDVGLATAQHLLGIFKDDADKRIAAISDIVENGGETEDLRRQAHSLKGLCSTYGALAGEKAAKNLQDACDVEDQDAIAAKAKVALEVIPADIDATLKATKEL